MNECEYTRVIRSSYQSTKTNHWRALNFKTNEWFAEVRWKSVVNYLMKFEFSIKRHTLSSYLFRQDQIILLNMLEINKIVLRMNHEFNEEKWRKKECFISKYCYFIRQQQIQNGRDNPPVATQRMQQHKLEQSPPPRKIASCCCCCWGCFTLIGVPPSYDGVSA
jgi:hypothetical protein